MQSDERRTTATHRRWAGAGGGGGKLPGRQQAGMCHRREMLGVCARGGGAGQLCAYCSWRTHAYTRPSGTNGRPGGRVRHPHTPSGNDITTPRHEPTPGGHPTAAIRNAPAARPAWPGGRAPGRCCCCRRRPGWWTMLRPASRGGGGQGARSGRGWAVEAWVCVCAAWGDGASALPFPLWVLPPPCCSRRGQARLCVVVPAPLLLPSSSRFQPLAPLFPRPFPHTPRTPTPLLQMAMHG